MEDYGKIEQQIPEIESLIGTSSVDAKEIESRFPGASQAIDIVNEFDSSLLINVAYIYNTHDEAAFGVFNPTLNETINWLRVKKELESDGFQTNIKTDVGPGDQLYAYAPGMGDEEIKQKMTSIFSEKDRTGGVAIGIDTERILKISDDISSRSQLEADQTSNLKIAELASVIAHEATHAKGETGESTPQQVQGAVLQFAINKFKIPVELSGEMIHASGNNWYKKSQVAPFTWKGIEVSLRNNYFYDSQFFPVKKEINDSPEKVLSENSHTGDQDKKGTEADLEPDRNGGEEKPTESLLDERRVHPLILPIPKAASFEPRMIKIAGWQSNLGGGHIGGVFGYMNGMDPAWETPFEAEEIQDRPSSEDYTNRKYWERRYNPMYSAGKISVDRMGHPFFNYDFQVDLASFEQRNWPSKFDERPSYWPNRPDIAVAASSKSDCLSDSEKNFVLNIIKKLGYYKSLVRSGKRKAARIIMDSEWIEPALASVSDCSHILFCHNDKIVLWITGNCSDEEIEKIEDNITEQRNYDQVNDFVSLSESIKDSVNKIFSKCKLLCKQHGIRDVFAVGGFVRTLAGTKNFSEVNDIDFSSTYPDDCLKLGGLLASDLGIDDIGFNRRTSTMSFEYGGIKIDFRGKYIPYDVRPFLRQHTIKCTPLNFDIYARDFTVNSLIYSFVENKIYDVSGRGIKDLNDNILNTFFDPYLIIPLNPIIITRAILLNLRGFAISDELCEAMKQNYQCLFNGKLDEQRLAYEGEKILRYGDDGEYMLSEYNLHKLKDIAQKYKKNYQSN